MPVASDGPVEGQGNQPSAPPEHDDVGSRGKGYLVAGLLLLGAYAACVAAMALRMAGPPDPGVALANLPAVLAAFAPLGLTGAALAAISRLRSGQRSLAAAAAAVTIGGIPAGAAVLTLAFSGGYALLLVAFAVLAVFAVLTVRRPRLWPAFVALVIVPLVAFAAYFTWASLNGYGTSPTYRVDSYGELRADLSRDCPGVRFPNLSRYEGVPGFVYGVDYQGGRVTMLHRGYSVVNAGKGGIGGMKAAADEVGVESEIALLEISCQDLRQFDGRSAVAPTVAPNMEHCGVEVERSEAEFDVTEENREHDGTFQGYPVGSRYGRISYEFDIGDYFYRTGVSYGIPPGMLEEEAQGVRDAADREARVIAFSIIDQ